jgi:O-methyltransferase
LVAESGIRKFGEFVVKPVLESAARIRRRCTGLLRGAMRFPTYTKDVARRIANSGDRVRYASLGLALETIRREGIPGDLAELGVWRGLTSSFVHSQVPQRTLYLFDTFAGFPDKDGADARFQDTTVQAVRRRINDCSNVIFKVGTFPETARGLESERFAFVLIDVDKYVWTLAGLTFFYPRISPGGYIFVHDYNSPESEHGVARAVREFLNGKPEQVIEIPDVWGSAVFRKVAPVSTK